MTLIFLEKKPKLVIGSKLHFDNHRQQWMILAPERMICLDEISKEIIELCVGDFSVEIIIKKLASKFDAPTNLIQQDVLIFLEALFEKGAIRYV